MPTDTIYGVVGQALNKKTVERIYTARKRMPSKPMIILISSVNDLRLFGIEKEKINLPWSPEGGPGMVDFWPGKTSIILPCPDEKFHYLHRGSNFLAFRLPADAPLRQFISRTGPLVAPSANLEGLPPATTIEEAQNYFGDSVNFYIDGGKIAGKPSKLIKIEGDKIIELRK